MPTDEQPIIRILEDRTVKILAPTEHTRRPTMGTSALGVGDERKRIRGTLGKNTAKDEHPIL
ncbi:MAG: hypothetical protein U9O89_00805 [Thermoproteota archaeon]|nr:hypothetical protein [Thermoproteota archaeon]